ncbi:MAG: hypothetical protein H7124_04380 [Phycisphaerales bacterium]|nr:hypothetical protein [Hyphomonadaceae bacterium]
MVALSRARVSNAMLRLGASGVVSIVATSVVGHAWPLYWFAGLVGVVLMDRAIFARVLAEAERGKPPLRLWRLAGWTTAQSIYGNVLAAMLWFSTYLPGETLAMMYILGGLANAATTLRFSHALSIAGAGPTIAFMLGLPLADYSLSGANALDLMPLVAGLLVLGFGVNLWRSLLASDAAQAQAEAAVLRERQAAAAAAAAKSDTIQRMNDELRTPMAALIGAAEHLRRAAASPQARAHIATIVQAGEVLKLVLGDLSDLDRLENGELSIDAKPADPRDIARSVVAAFRPAAQDKHLELFLDLAPDAPALVEMDALRVRQVLFNLLANAVRYTTHGGVRVGLSVQPSQMQARALLSFTVADTGAGLSRSQLALIFGRGRICSEGEGPGLGLGISLRLAKLMGGQLQAKSELGEGSVFSFTLDAPVIAEAGAPRAA